MYAHIITAQLSCHLKHFVAISLLKFVEIQKIFNNIQMTMKLYSENACVCVKWQWNARDWLLDFAGHAIQ